MLKFIVGVVVFMVLVLFVSKEYPQSLSTMRSKSTTPTHLFVAAAFHAREREWSTKLLIRMLVLADNTHINRELECTSFDQKVVAKVELLERKKGVGCRWRSFFVDCAFSNPRIDKFNLTLRHDALKHTIDVQKAGHRHHSLVVCYSRAFRLERWQSVISAIHFYSYQQVDFLDIRLASAVDSVYELLRAYEAEGRIQLRPALILPSLSDLIDYDANEEVDVYHQTLNYDACLYEHREMADFIIFADFDDLLHGPILKELKRLTANYPLAASFEFAWPPAAILDVKEPAKFELKSFVESLTWSSTGVDLPLYGKSVVRPLRIRHSFVHRPLLPEVQLVNRFEHHYLPNSSIVFVHARHFVEQEFFDSNDLKHAQRSRVNFTALTDDFLRFLNRNSTYRELFLQLPTSFPYYDATRECSEQRRRSCFNPMVCVPIDQSLQLPSFTKLRIERKTTVTNTLDLYIHSAQSTVFEISAQKTSSISVNHGR